MTHRFPRPVNILLVEDNDADVRLVEEALRGRSQEVALHRVSDGDQALAFLHRREPFVDRPQVDLVLLDLNLPRVDGHEVLADIKTAPDLHRIPVVMLTVSGNDDDIRRSYDLLANSYVTKPSNPEAFFEVLDRTVDFWVRASHLPGA